ncbi:MAG: hypothetical protein AAGD01_01395 [Acidobacteriota bacterium]
MPNPPSKVVAALAAFALRLAPGVAFAMAAATLTAGRRDPTAAAEDALLGILLSFVLLATGIALPRPVSRSGAQLALATALALTVLGVMPPGPTRGATATALAAWILFAACCQWRLKRFPGFSALAAVGAAAAVIATPESILALLAGDSSALIVPGLGALLGVGAGVLDKRYPFVGFPLSAIAFTFGGGATLWVAIIPWIALVAIEAYWRLRYSRGSTQETNEISPDEARRKLFESFDSSSLVAAMLASALFVAVISGYPWNRSYPGSAFKDEVLEGMVDRALDLKPSKRAVLIENIPYTLSARSPRWSSSLAANSSEEGSKAPDGDSTADSEGNSGTDSTANSTASMTLDLVTAAANSADLHRGTPLATLILEDRNGKRTESLFRYGVHTGEWAGGREDLQLRGLPAPPHWVETVAPEGHFFARRYRSEHELTVDELQGTPVEVIVQRRPDLPDNVTLTLHRLEVTP